MESCQCQVYLARHPHSVRQLHPLSTSSAFGCTHLSPLMQLLFLILVASFLWFFVV